MILGFLAPIPIFASLAAADVLSPETHVPLAWLYGGIAGSGAIIWWTAMAYGKQMGRMNAIEKLNGDTAREVSELKRQVQELRQKPAG